MNSPFDAIVREEVESLHRFFVGWFSGTLPKSEWERGFLSRFDPEFVLIPPTGAVLGLDELAASLLASHATKPDFRITIQDVTVRRVSGDQILATYIERQDSGQGPEQYKSARITTAVFKNVEPLLWVHVHETWLPVTGPPGK